MFMDVTFSTQSRQISQFLCESTARGEWKICYRTTGAIQYCKLSAGGERLQWDAATVILLRLAGGAHKGFGGLFDYERIEEYLGKSDNNVAVYLKSGLFCSFIVILVFFVCSSSQKKMKT